jgi:nucleoside-diphosphate-sugar epimerase
MEMLDLFIMAQKGYILMPPKGRASFIHVEDLARLIIALIPAHEDATAQIFECDDGAEGGWSHDSFGRAVGMAIDKQVTAINAPKILLKIGALFDQLFRGKKAKLTWDRANYLSHPDWVIDRASAPSPSLWKPAIETRQGLKDTARWYRKNGLID